MLSRVYPVVVDPRVIVPFGLLFDGVPVVCLVCRASHGHSIRGRLGDPAVLTCVNGHGVPWPAGVDAVDVVLQLIGMPGVECVPVE